MIGTLDPSSREVTIIGAGFAGLVAAYQLDRSGYEVTLIEASDRVGGMIRTQKTQWGIAESAAHSFLATSDVLALCQDLGVQLVPVNKGSRTRYILRTTWLGQRMRRFPLSVGELVRSLLRAYFVLSSASASLGTLEDWALRYLGRAPLKFLVTPFVYGIYGARPSELKVEVAFPGLVVPPGHSLLSFVMQKWRRRVISRKKAPPRSQMMTPLHGMGSLIDALQRRLEANLGNRLKKNTSLLVLPEVKNLILCVPPSVAADLLRSRDPETSQALSEVPHAPLITATIFVERDAFTKEEPRGVGVLMAEMGNRKSLGILFNSSAFPGRASEGEKPRVSLTMMLGGTPHPELLAKSDSSLNQIIRDELNEILGVSPKHPGVDLVIQRWQKAIPIYGGALELAWKSARKGWCARPGRILFGNYTGQVSLRGMIETTSKLCSAPSVQKPQIASAALSSPRVIDTAEPK